MKVFVVALDADGASASTAVEQRMKSSAASLYRLSPTVFVVAGDYLSNELAEAAGLKGGDRLDPATGAVFRIDSYSGYTNRALWEWLERYEV